MEHYNPRADEYIDNAGDFARPILLHIRHLMHRAHPQIEEKIKWGHIHFDYKGPVSYMAAFKQHCNFGFWKASLMPDPQGLLKNADDPDSKLNRLKTLADLPDDETFIEYILNAIMLNEQGIKVSKKKEKAPAGVLVVPDDFVELLNENLPAKNNFEKFPAGKQKEYIDWITEAKTEATRQKRMQTATEWIAEGKSRHWKYQ